MSANVIPVQSEPLDADAARRLDGRIRLMSESVAGGITKLADLIDEARRGQIHQALGFASWPAYLADAVSRLALAVDAAGRRDLVALMAGEGMSNRAIAQAVGVSEGTVRNDKVKVRNDYAPDKKPLPVLEPLVDAAQAQAAAVIDRGRNLATVIGIDGKTYRPKPPPAKTDAAERDDIDELVDWQLGGMATRRSPRRRPITDAFDEGVYKVSKMAASLERLSGDDRFDRNLDGLKYRRSDLVRARDALNRVLAKLGEAVVE